MKRIQLKRPEAEHQFDIQNGSLTRPFSWWEFNTSWQQSRQLADWGASDRVSPKLNEILRIFGPYCSLWLDDWEGTLVPMDVPPDGWTYPNGDKLEPEWWWEWHPSQRTNAEAVKFLNKPIDLISLDRPAPFKCGVPFQMKRKMGEIVKIEAIPIQQLAAISHKDSDWTFCQNVSDRFASS